MASYIPSISDYIPTLQPFKPDLNFMGNVLQAKQSKYDVAKKQISSIYGTMLNSPLSRDTNVKKREEFFNAIDGQIQQISGLDLSLQQNQEFASNVFNGLLDDKNIKKDMIWSKNFENELQRAEGFKLCVDPTKCGGKYWDGGIEEMQYRKQEFKNMSDEEALAYGDVSFTPAQDVTGKTLAFIKDHKLEIKHDSIRGGYKVTTKNGTDATPHFQSLLMSAFATDPAMVAYYKSQSFIERKRTTGGDPANEALYIQRKMNEASSTNNKVKTKLTTEVETNNVLLDSFIKEMNAMGVDPTADASLMENFKEQWGANEAMKTTLAVYDEQGKLIQNTELNSSNLRIAGANIDAINGVNKLQNELGKIANDYAMATFEQTMEADPFAVASYKAQLDMQADIWKNGSVDPKTGEFIPGRNTIKELYEIEKGIRKDQRTNYKKPSTGGLTNSTGITYGAENTNRSTTQNAETESDIEKRKLIVLENTATATTTGVAQSLNNIQVSQEAVIDNLIGSLNTLKSTDSTKTKEIEAFSKKLFGGIDVTTTEGKAKVKNLITFNKGKGEYVKNVMTSIKNKVNSISVDLQALGITNSLTILNTVGSSLSTYDQNMEWFKKTGEDIQVKSKNIVDKIYSSYKESDPENASYVAMALNSMTQDTKGIPNITKNKDTVIRAIASKLQTENKSQSGSLENQFKNLGQQFSNLYNINLNGKTDDYTNQIYLNQATEIYNKVATDVLEATPSLSLFSSPSLPTGETSGIAGAVFPTTITKSDLDNAKGLTDKLAAGVLFETGNLSSPMGEESQGFPNMVSKLIQARLTNPDSKDELDIRDFQANVASIGKQNSDMIGTEITLPPLMFNSKEMEVLIELDSKLANQVKQGTYTFTVLTPKTAILNDPLVQASTPDIQTWNTQMYGSTYKGTAGSTIIINPTPNGDVKVTYSYKQVDGSTATSTINYPNLREFYAENPKPNEFINEYDIKLQDQININKKLNRNGNQQ